MRAGEEKYLIALVESLIRDAKCDLLDRALEIIDNHKKSCATTLCNGFQLLEALELDIIALKENS